MMLVRFLAGAGVSFFGDWLTTVALVVVLFQDSGSVVGPAAYMVVRMAPRVVGSAPGGALADRFSARAVMVGCSAVQALLGVGILLGVVASLPWAIFTGVALSALAGSAARPSHTVLIRELAPPGRLAAANALYSMIYSASLCVAPAVGGLLLAVSGAPVVVACDVATFVVAAALGMTLRPRRAAPALSAPGIRGGALGEVWRTPVLRSLAAATLANSAVATAAQSLLVVVARDRLAADSAVGLLYGAVGAGSVVAGLVLLRHSPAMAGRPAMMLFGLLEMIAIAAVIAPVPGPVTLALFVVSGAAGVVYQTLGRTETQRRVSPEQLGRAGGVVALAAAAGMVLGAAVVASTGPVASWQLILAAVTGAAALVVVSTGIGAGRRAPVERAAGPVAPEPPTEAAGSGARLIPVPVPADGGGAGAAAEPAAEANSGRPRLLSLYVLLVAAGALAAAVLLVRPVDDVAGLAIATILVLGLALGSISTFAGQQLVQSGSTFIQLGMALVYGPLGALVAATGETMGVTLPHYRRERQLRKVLFNLAQHFLSNLAAWAAFSGMLQTPLQEDVRWLAAGTVAGLARFAANRVQLALVLHLATGEAVERIARRMIVLAHYEAVFGAGTAAFVILHDAAGSVAFALLGAPLVGLHVFLVAFARMQSRHDRTERTLRISVERSYDTTMVALTRALDARDKETEGHSRRVVEYTRLIAVRIGVSGDELGQTLRGALLHDIGKIGVPDSILHKPTKLSPAEWEVMRRHPQMGARMIEDAETFAETRRIILHHHERWDGSGYPLGLLREEICRGARIFALADAVDAITQDRPYRLGRSLDQARDEIGRHRGSQFDPDVVDAFLEVDEESLLLVARLRHQVDSGLLSSLRHGPPVDHIEMPRARVITLNRDQVPGDPTDPQRWRADRVDGA